MDIMTTIKETLDSNNNLSNGVKENIYELINIFHEKFPDVDLETLNSHLLTLQIKRINRFMNNDVSMYNVVENVIYLNNDKLTEDYDARHILMYELLNMISSKDGKKGFIDEGRFEALNVGYTEILANYLVGNEGEKEIYREQAIETNLLSMLVGVDTFKEAYFTNNSSLLIEGFMKAGVRV